MRLKAAAKGFEEAETRNFGRLVKELSMGEIANLEGNSNSLSAICVVGITCFFLLLVCEKIYMYMGIIIISI